MLIELNGHEKDSGIYKITNLVNGRIYIGSAVKLAQRSREHGRTLRGNRHRNPFLQHDFNKCGDSNFKFEIIETVFDKEELIKREQYYLDQYFDYKVNCYNICPTAGNSLGRVFSEETKAKIGAKAKGRKSSDETKAAISAGGLAYRERARKEKDAKVYTFKSPEGYLVSFKDIKGFCAIHPELNLRCLQVVHLGKNAASPRRTHKGWTKGKIGPMTCKTHSEATKQKMSKSRKGKSARNHRGKNSPETRAKISSANKGLKRSPSAKANMLAVNAAIKNWCFVSPTGEIVKIRNLKQFCREHELIYSSMQNLRNGKVKQHLGWKRSE